MGTISCKVYNKNVGKLRDKNVIKPIFLFCIYEYIDTLIMEVNR